jgi:hypothetical protein
MANRPDARWRRRREPPENDQPHRSLARAATLRAHGFGGAVGRVPAGATAYGRWQAKAIAAAPAVADAWLRVMHRRANAPHA